MENQCFWRCTVTVFLSRTWHIWPPRPNSVPVIDWWYIMSRHAHNAYKWWLQCLIMIPSRLAGFRPSIIDLTGTSPDGDEHPMQLNASFIKINGSCTGGAFEDLIHCFWQTWVSITGAKNQSDRESVEIVDFWIENPPIFLESGIVLGGNPGNARDFHKFTEVHRPSKKS